MSLIIFPKDNVRVTQIYKDDTHPGMDFGGNRIGDKVVRCVAKGKVLRVGKGTSFGNYVVIYHKDIDMSSLYLHLDKTLVNEDDEIYKGLVIGTEGSTGHSTGDHLHFGLYKGVYKSYRYNHVNPLSYCELGVGQMVYVGAEENEISEVDLKECSDHDDSGECQTCEWYKKKLEDIQAFIDEALEYGN